MHAQRKNGGEGKERADESGGLEECVGKGDGLQPMGNVKGACAKEKGRRGKEMANRSGGLKECGRSGEGVVINVGYIIKKTEK